MGEIGESGNARPRADDLTPRQAGYVAARLTGQTQKAAAAKAGLSDRTARRYDKLPQVQRALRAGQDELIGDALATALVLLRPAIGGLMSIGNDGEAPASARVAALRAVADLALTLREHDDIAQRLALVEEKLSELHAPTSEGRSLAIVH